MISEKMYIRLVILHAIIGVSIYGFKMLSKVYFILIFIFFIYSIINSKSKKRYVNILIACSYVVGSEVLLRMTGGNFMYEASKYFVIFFIFLGLFFEGISTKAFPYLFFLILLIPSIFVAGETVSYDINLRTAITFNLSGPVCLGLTALYCYDRKIKFKELQNVLLAALLPIISTGVYLFVFTPNIREVVTGTFSNFSTSGGFGPNQVATALGLGMFIVASRYYLSSKNMFLKLFNLSVFGFITYRGIVTFSRGGIFTAVIVIIAFMVIYYFSSIRANRRKILNHLYVFMGLLLVIWFVSSFQTKGLIDKRYANQDAAGRVKEDLATGRGDLISFELNEFLEHPFFGIGAGMVKGVRYEKEGHKTASHNEVSRLLAEHGMFGVLAFLIIFWNPLIYRIKNKKNIFFYSFFLFWFLTINHTSTRIAAPAFIYGLSLLNVQYEKNPVDRKQIKGRKF